MKAKGTRKRDIVDRFVLFFNILAVVALLLSYLGGSVSPEQWWPLAFLGLGYPVLLLVMLCFIVYWILRRKWFLFINLAVLLLKWDYVGATVQASFWKSDADTGIRVMTYNVRLFDHYNWTKDKFTGTKAQDFIFNQQSDILCMQEFYNPPGNTFHAIDTLLASNRLRHIHTENYVGSQRSKNVQGLATLTSFPILNKDKIVFNNSKSALVIYTDVLIGSDTVRIYNVHLQSIHLGHQGYAIIDELMEKQELENVEEGKQVLSQMKKGFIKRAEQARILAEHIQNCGLPVIVCGDFNDVPTSYTYQTIAQGLNDSFSESGTGLGSTYVRVPFFRIDNILFSKEFEAGSHTVHPSKLSDHLAVTATLKRLD